MTLLSVVIAFLLFGLLQGVNTWLNNALIGAARLPVATALRAAV